MALITVKAYHEYYEIVIIDFAKQTPHRLIWLYVINIMFIVSVYFVNQVL